MKIIRGIRCRVIQREKIRPGLSQQFLIFIFKSWGVNHTEIRSVVAKYLTGSGIKAGFLVPKIRTIITEFYVYGFIVNNVSGDGAIENQSNFQQSAIMTVNDIFKTRCGVCSKTALDSLHLSLLDELPNEKLPVAFLHPCEINSKVVISGEMHNWVKKIMNQLERTTSSTNNISLNF